VTKKKDLAPAWLVAEAISFLRADHPSVLQCISNLYHSTGYKTVEDWLKAEDMTWGTKLMTLLTFMDYKWDIDMLRKVWLGIVASALKEEGLVDPNGRKLEPELRKKL
jgi:hypothetical protein